MQKKLDTWIPFQLREEVRVVITIYSLLGRRIRVLDLRRKAAGFYITREEAAYWDGRDASDESTGSGVYFYTIEAGDFRQIRKMTVVR